jgi:hypothetical protein
MVAKDNSDRPYLNSSIDEIVALVQGKKVPDSVVKHVLKELEHRRSSRAKKLMAQLQKSHPHLKSAPGATVKRPATPQRATARRVSREQSPVMPPTIVYEENAVAYESLRNTFTEEGEILARWGMTPTLPDAIMKKIFEMWKEHLSKSKDSMFRTLLQLESDQAKLQKIRTARNAKAGGK